MRNIKKLGKPSIKQAIIEIRYKCGQPVSAIYGLLLDVFRPLNVIQMPVLQLPENLRLSDPNLKYEEYYRGVKTEDNIKYAFGIGSNIIRFSVLDRYSSWNHWKNFFEPIMKKIEATRILNSSESISLRYFDIFQKNIFPEINAKFVLNGNEVLDYPTLFRTTFADSNVDVITNLSNKISVNGEPQQNSSLIDIECRKQFSKSSADFFKDYIKILDEEHEINKKNFFLLLKESLLNELEPIYE